MLKYCFILLFFLLGMPKHHHQINDTAIDIEIFKLERKIESMNAQAWLIVRQIKNDER